MPLNITLGPVAQAHAAVIAANVDTLADAIAIHTHPDCAADFRPAPGYEPNSRLKKAAARGVAIRVCGDLAVPIAAEPDDVAKRLKALGVSDHVAKGVVETAIAHQRLTPSLLSDEQATAAIVARLNAAHLNTEVY